MGMLEKVLSRDNLMAALKRVEDNRGAAGVDGVSTEQLRDYLRQHWATIRSQIEKGTYKPTPVRRVEIPKNLTGECGCWASLPWQIASSSRPSCRY